MLRRRLVIAVWGLCLACAGELASLQAVEPKAPTTGDDFPAVTNHAAETDLTPLPAEAAAAGIQLPQGFRATLFAAEPEVQNPIAMAWDERGRLWIAENYTYSDRSQRFDLSLRDRVLIFQDSDHDGRADQRKVFTDDVQMLTSVEVGRGGVWLMCPPQLLFIPDADGDDCPDGPAQVMLDGFDVAQDNYHNFANGLRWGPDGWLYGRCGHSCPGRIGVPGTPAAARVPIDGGMWRFSPGRKIVEVLCHGTTNPWGHDWDQHGELFFINTVIGHLWHVVPGAHFKESFGESMNPAVYQRMDMIADHYHFDTRGSWTDSRDGKANDLGGGHAHIGMLIYQGSQWPEKYRGKLLTINMHGLRANVERLERTATGYVGRHEPDFFIASDPFFRGIDLSCGPDGSVLVIDWSDTGECHEHSGVHRLSGRIFKITYDAAESRAPQPVIKPSCLQGQGRLPELWRDYQAGKTTAESLRKLEQDEDEHVRVWAIRLLVDDWPLDWVTGPNPNAIYPDDPATRAILVRMARDDPSGLVQRVLASTLQRLPLEHRAALAIELAQRAEYADDPDLPLLVWYGLIPLGDAMAPSLVDVARHSRWPQLTSSIARLLASRIHSDPQSLNELLLVSGEPEPTDAEFRKSLLLGMQDAFRGWRKAPQPAAWEKFASHADLVTSADVVRELSSLFGDGRALTELRQIAVDEGADMKSRQNALRALIDARPDDLRQVCESLLEVRSLNATALRGLALFDDPAVATLLSRKYKRFHPSDRPLVIETLVSRPGSAAVLLEELSSTRSQIPLADITASHARQIQSLGDESLTRQLSKAWGELRDSSAEKLELIGQLQRRLTPEALSAADLSHGRVLFTKTCGQCHLLYGAGQTVGPDLTGSQRSNLDYLLSNIVDPSAVVGKDYRMSIVMLADGRVLNGLVMSKDAQTLVLRTATEQVTLTLDDVELIKESPLSAMPDGLLQNLEADQIRDLIAYLQHPVQVPLPDDVRD
jgi:putative membrane-bound dehydrogenase-like protein